MQGRTARLLTLSKYVDAVVLFRSECREDGTSWWIRFTRVERRFDATGEHSGEGAKEQIGPTPAHRTRIPVPTFPTTGAVLITVIGSVFGVLYERTDNLAVPIVVHGVYNALLMSISYVGVVYG